MKKLIAITLFIFLASAVCCAQYSFSGRLLNEQQEPLAGATIALAKAAPLAITDSLGNYHFSYTNTSAELVFSHVGYQSLVMRLKTGQATHVMLLHSNDLLTETIVRAFEKNSTAKNISASITVLGKRTLERYNNQSFVAAMNNVPGVRMDERSPGSYRLSIRGNLLRSAFGVRNVKVYWDGIPFTDANGNTYVNELAFDNIGKMEIIKGPSGSMYGAGTGGVLLLTGNAASVKGKELSLQLTGGSYGLFSAGASYTQVSSKANASYGFSHQQQDGYRNHTNLRRDVANYSGVFTLSTRQKITAHLFYADLYYQTPGGLNLAELAKDPAQSRPAAGAFQSAEAQQAALYLKTLYAGLSQEYRISERWTNTTGVYFSRTNSKGPSIRNIELKRETGVGGRSVFQYKKNIFTATFGGEYQYGFTNTSVYGNRLGVVDTLQYHDEISAGLYNVFLQTDIAVTHQLNLTAGISYNNCHYGFSRKSVTPVTAQDGNFGKRFIPRVGLVQELCKEAAVYASVSRGFSPPSIDEIHASDGKFNLQLSPESGTNYEAGIKTTLLKNRLSFDISYYSLILSNTIVSRRDASGADYYVNTGETKQQGLESSLNYSAINKQGGGIRKLSISANYTHLHARFTNYQQGTVKYDGNDLTGTTPNVFAAGLDLLTGAGVYADLSYRYTDKIALNDANSFYAAAYNWACIKLGIKTPLSRTIRSEFFVAAEKSFNTPYSLGNDLNAAGNRYFNPSAPRSFTIGAKLSFKVK